MNKYIIKGLAIFSLITLAACTDSRDTDTTEPVDQENNSEQTSNQTQYILPQSFSVQTVSIETGTDDILLNYKDNIWEATGLENPDLEAVSFFVEELLNIVGKPVEEDFTGETTFTLSNSDQSIDVTMGNNETIQLIQVDDQVFEVEKLPLALNPFDPVFLEESIALNLDDLIEVTFENNGETMKLNQSTSLNEVETLPFISGWYLHDEFETDFSIEYYWINTLLGQLTGLKASPTGLRGDTVGQRITLSDGTSEETLHISEDTEAGKTVVYLENKAQTILMPSQVTDLFEFDPLEVVDNFVALIPLNAVERVDISSPDNNYSIRVDRTIEVNDNETNVSSYFYLNDEEVEEEAFRRTYQYLARLSYSERLTQEDQNRSNEDSEITIIYQYLNAGETVEILIKLIPIENSNEYIVEKEGIVEFKVTDEKLNDMFDALDSINK